METMPLAPARSAARLCLALTLAWAVPTVRAEIRYRGYVPTFPAPAPAMGVPPEGAPGTWLGGDGSFCCPLDATRSFWTFCDAGIGRPGAKDREGSIGIGNTIAIATCKDGRFAVEHYFKGSPDRPSPFFPDPENPANREAGTRFWPRKSVLHNGHLYLFAHQVADPGSVVYNTKLIRVRNPLDPPSRWDYDILALGVNLIGKGAGGEEILPHPAPIHFGNEAFLDVAGNYLYTYGVIVSQKSPEDYFATFQATALRIPLDRLEAAPGFADLGRFSEFLSKEPGVWKPGLYEPGDYHKVDIPAVLAFSVRYNETLKAWQVVFAYDRAIAQNLWRQLRPDDPKPRSAYIMTGPGPYGPWGEPRLLARFPEMDPEFADHPDRGYDADNFCYALAEQPAFEAWDGDVIFTYSSGSIGQARDKANTRLHTDMKAYRAYAWPAAHPWFGPLPMPTKP